MASHHRHARRARRRWCAGLAAVAVAAALLASANTASAAASASSAECSGAASAEALVPFDTIAYNGTAAGVRVGPMFCPDPDGQAVQVVVLNGKTLGLLSNRGYATSQFGNLGSDLQALPSSDLVIVTHPGNQPALPSSTLSQLDTSLSQIGGTLGASSYFGQNSTAVGCSSLYPSYCENSGAAWKRGTLNGSSFTIVGIPKMPAGQAWRETAAQNQTADGRITGYLEKGTILSTGGPERYTVVNGPDPYVAVNTCVDPANPANLNDTSCAVKVGDHTYPADSGVNGLHVVELDRTTLAPIVNRTVTSTSALNSALTGWLPVPAVGHYINPPNFVNDQRLVIIQSVGDGKLSGTLSTATLQALDQLGGTVDYLAAAATQGCRYALIGAATDLPWHATSSAESSTAMVKPGQPCSNPNVDTDVPSGQLDGVVQRDRDGLYTPAATDAVGPTNVDLYRILYQPATAWPFAGDPGLKYVADHLGLCTPQACDYPDVRSAYSNLNISFSSLITPLGDLKCTQGPEVCGTDFPALQDELANEFHWVENVRRLVTNLVSPYTIGGPLGAFDVQKITDQIVNSIPSAADKSTTMKWLKVISGVMSIASKAAGLTNKAAGAVFGIVGAASTIATALMQTSNGGPADSVTAAAKDLGSKLAYQQADYQEWVGNMGDILVADYGKLKAVGTAIDSDKSWNWTNNTTNYVTTALMAGTRSAAYSALLPVAWDGYMLVAGTDSAPNPNDVANFNCAEAQIYIGIAVQQSAPFKNAAPANQFHSIGSFNINTGAVLKRVWTFAKASGFADNQVPAATVPTTSLTDDIYGDASTDPTVGAYQYEADWWRSTYNPPSHATCNQLPIPDKDTAPRPFSTSWPPPTVTPPVP